MQEMTAQWDSYVLALHIGACFYMTGVIAVIQSVHYPSFADIADLKFVDFHRRHSDGLGFIVGPVMVVELATALWLCHNLGALAILNFAAVLGLWLSTFLISVPCHNSLASGFLADAHRKLVRTNWIRTALWSSRSLAFLLVLATRI